MGSRPNIAASRRVEWSDWDERHGRKSREAAVREMGIDRIQSLKRYIDECRSEISRRLYRRSSDRRAANHWSPDFNYRVHWSGESREKLPRRSHEQLRGI